MPLVHLSRGVFRKISHFLTFRRPSRAKTTCQYLGVGRIWRSCAGISVSAVKYLTGDLFVRSFAPCAEMCFLNPPKLTPSNNYGIQGWVYGQRPQGHKVPGVKQSKVWSEFMFTKVSFHPRCFCLVVVVVGGEGFTTEAPTTSLHEKETPEATASPKQTLWRHWIF